MTMAVVLVQEGEMMSTELYDEVEAKLDAHDNPPDGLIVHTAGQAGEMFRIVDVWESRDAYERFAEDRLRPALAEVMNARGIDPNAGPQPTIYETHDLIRP
jgi:hypothetical protein